MNGVVRLNQFRAIEQLIARRPLRMKEIELLTYLLIRFCVIDMLRTP